jgi:MFS superfamily sulfate permease-like transporter
MADDERAPTGLAANWRHDLLSGFLVFLIALPLCLGISLASGFPATAGIYTAIIGGVLCSFISNSELTIKGPAAALIVVALAAVIELGSGGAAGSLADLTPEQQGAGYRRALATGVVAGLLQVCFGLLRLGRLGEFFPNAAVQGLLASVGVIIFAKQIYVVLGVVGKKGEVLSLLTDLPGTLLHPFAHGVNPAIALIGGVSLLILFALPLIKGRMARLFPAPLVVLLVAVPLGISFDLMHGHDYTFEGRAFHLGEELLVTLPASIAQGFSFPDFSALETFTGWKYVIMFALVGSLVSLLAAKAVDGLDPWKRKSDLNRDLLAIGVANSCAALIGGLPMISEIVRSRANIDNGGRTRWADAFHSLFLLACVALIPGLLHHIPLAALGAMLVYTGFRLASPAKFLSTYRIGVEQLAIFVCSLLAALATDLLQGIAVGIAVKLLLHMLNGAPPRSLFSADISVEKRSERDFMVVVRRAAVFSNWPALKRRLEAIGPGASVTLDLSETRLVDHTVMEKLHELEQEHLQQGGSLTVIGLDAHRPFSDHPHAGRKKRLLKES